MEKLKAELSAAGVKAEIVNSIGDGSDPIFQPNRYGVRPPSDLMEIIKDFAGWKLYGRQGWFSKTAAKRRPPWRTAALKIGYPYEVIEPAFEKIVQNVKLSSEDFKPSNIWIFPLEEETLMTGQVAFQQLRSGWTINENVGVPSDVLKIEAQLGIENMEIRRVCMLLFGGYDKFVGYVPMDGNLEDGSFYFWERIYKNHLSKKQSKDTLTVEIRSLNFRQLEKTLSALAQKYRTAEALKLDRAKMEGVNHDN